MYKIAILGCENSHADIFMEFIRTDKQFSDVEVIGAYSDEPQSMENFASKYGVQSMLSPDELAGKVDGVMVTARHGDSHLNLLKPYLSSGIPIFVDKPITISIEDAKELRSLLQKYKNSFTGGSVLKYCDEIKELKNSIVSAASDEKIIGGLVKAPLIRNSEHGGIYFYAPHLIEILCEVFGRFPKSVISTKNDTCITSVFRYDTYDITAVFTEMNVSRNYFVLRIGTDNCYPKDIKLEDKHFKEEFEHFYRLLKTKEYDENIKDFFAPVYILEALDRSLQSEKEEKIIWDL